jgi:signal transduction histidine kinase
MSPLPDTMEPAVKKFVQRLRAIYQGMDTTLVQLETVLHVDSTTLSRYFNGISLPEQGFIDDLFDALHSQVGHPPTEELRKTTHDLYVEALEARDPRRFEVHQLRCELQEATRRAALAEEEAIELKAELAAGYARQRELELGLRQLESYVSRALGPQVERLQLEHRAAVAVRDELEERIREQTRELTEKLLELRALERAYDQVLGLLQLAEERLEQELHQRWDQAEPSPQGDQASDAQAPTAFSAPPPPPGMRRSPLRSRRIRSRMLLMALFPLAGAAVLLTTGDTVLTAAILGVAVVATAFVSYSVTSSLRALRNTALDIASSRLPEMVSRLREGNDYDFVETSPVALTGTGEVAEVALAFDMVHREAVRLAAEQAMLRNSVNTMFVNLSRRSQSLVERQLRLISELETTEIDPDQLISLAKVDHLASRMRRNGENLLVLAGEEPGRRWSRPMPLISLLRITSGEMEQYERIMVHDVPAVEVPSRAVDDLMRLVTELLDNATSFSPPDTEVSVSGVLRGDGGVLLKIEDSGVGMSVQDLDEANERLASPPVVDLAASRRMGLFVVARLAARHGIQARLRPSPTGGVTAVVVTPPTLVLPAPAEE